MDIDYNQGDGRGRLEYRAPMDDSYRASSECGRNRHPTPSADADGLGVRIAPVCPECGAPRAIDPFDDKRR